MQPSREDVEALIEEKYRGARAAPGLEADIARLEGGEPLAYVIGHIPFLGLSIDLTSHPLIPRPETEWWAEELITHINTSQKNTIIYDSVLRKSNVLDLCAGSGAIGLAVLKHCSRAQVSFGEIDPAHERLIRENIEANGLDVSRADIRIGDLFAPFSGLQFDIIAANPPYIPENRALPESVSHFEPPSALYAGKDGLDIIRRILKDAPEHMSPGGELWMECDIENIEEAERLAHARAAQTEIRTDPYGRPRLLVSYY